MKRNKVKSLRQRAKELDISPSYLSRILSGQRKGNPELQAMLGNKPIADSLLRRQPLCPVELQGRKC